MSEPKNLKTGTRPVTGRRRPGRIQLVADLNKKARQQHDDIQQSLLDFFNIKKQLEGVIETVSSILEMDGFEEQLNVMDDHAMEMVGLSTELELAECHVELAISVARQASASESKFYQGLSRLGRDRSWPVAC